MRCTRTIAAFLLSIAALGVPALADSTIHVKLWDKAAMMDMSKNMGMGMGMHGNMKMAMMGVETDQASVPAGKVTLDVVNVSADVIHEMLVAPVASLDAILPYNAKENRVEEEASGYLGEVSELDPGKGGALTLDLKPGLYLLFCNIPGHFAAGMWTTLEVK